MRSKLRWQRQPWLNGDENFFGFASLCKAVLNGLGDRYGDADMPFSFGQFYECDEDGRTRQVMVLTARNNGEEALLRYIDTRVEEWTKWSEFDKEKWRRTTSEK